MPFIIIILMMAFIGNSQAGELWKKYDLPYQINCLTGYKDYILAGTHSGGILKIDRNNGFQTQYTKERDNIGSNNVEYLAIDDSGKVCAGEGSTYYSEGWLSLFENNFWKLYKKDLDGLCGNDIKGLKVDKNNTFWVALNDRFSIGSGDSIYIVGRQVIQYYENSQWQFKKISTQSVKYYDGNFHFNPDNIRAGAFDVADSTFYAFVTFTADGYKTNLNVMNKVIYNDIFIENKLYGELFGKISIETKSDNNKVIWVSH